MGSAASGGGGNGAEEPGRAPHYGKGVLDTRPAPGSLPRRSFAAWPMPRPAVAALLSPARYYPCGNFCHECLSSPCKRAPRWGSPAIQHQVRWQPARRATGQQRLGGRGLSGLGVLRWRIAALAAVIAVILVSGTWFALTRASAQPETGRDAAAGRVAQNPPARHAAQASSESVRVLSVTPAPRARRADGAAPIRVVFSEPLAADSPLPTLSPLIPGSWRASGSTVEFV